MKDPQIRERLMAAIATTKKRIGQYEAIAKPIAPDNAIGRVSRMDAINNKSVTDAALRKAKEQLHGLERNLEKLGSSEFGVCIQCKKTIPIERILLAPESSFCVNCAR